MISIKTLKQNPNCPFHNSMPYLKMYMCLRSRAYPYHPPFRYETYQLMASAVTFATHMDALLALVR